MDLTDRLQGIPELKDCAFVEELGCGGMGCVYLMQRENTGEQLALKVMQAHLAADARARAMFLREAENCHALRHPNIVHTYTSGFANGIFFLTMEFCDRGNLDQLVMKQGIRPVDEALAIIFAVLSALEYAATAQIPHIKLADGSFGRGTGLVHRDLKPQNIFLISKASGSVAKVGDFGLAKAFDMAGLTSVTKTGEVAGTPAFMPRQQVLNFKYAMPEVDVWASAASLYYLLTGHTPRDFFPGRDPWLSVCNNDPVPIRERGVPIPVALTKVIDKALVDRPEIQFKTVAAFRDALEQVL